MKICSSLNSESDRDRPYNADMTEIRLDLMDHIPDLPDKELIITFRGDVDMSRIPPGFTGFLDIGEEIRPDTDLRIISSHHDFERTPDAGTIVSIIDRMDADIRKAAFFVRSFEDLDNIYKASQMIEEKHVLLGMGDIGTITRIRQNILANEFTFGYVSEPTAPGQLSTELMNRLGDDCMITGIAGYPLSKTRSPEMHNAAFNESDINGIYLKFESSNVLKIEDVMREYNIRGLNVTIPYKNDIIDHLDSLDHIAEDVGAVNTVVNDNGRLKGYNTDVIGIGRALSEADFDITGKRTLILGSGGSARACAYYMKNNGCDVTITGRNPETARRLSEAMMCQYRPKDSVSLYMYDLIVNCTPVGMYGDGCYPVNINRISRHQTVFDMVYGCRTPMIDVAERNGAGIIRGEDMLAGQGAASFELWTGEHDMFDTMRNAL